jgi:molybdopterin-guanine dinucleotide biosynthesis protein A
MTAPVGVILAGGLAARMGGGDKCLAPLAGRRLIDHVTARLAPQVAALALNANGDPARFAALGLPVIADPVPDRPGPLAGLLAGLDWAAGLGVAALVSVPGDTPFLPRDLVARLQAAAGPAGVAIAASPDAAGRLRAHPVCGLWPVALRGTLRAALAAGARRVLPWAEAQGARFAAFDAGPPDPFFNVNTPADLAAAEAALR